MMTIIPHRMPGRNRIYTSCSAMMSRCCHSRCGLYCLKILRFQKSREKSIEQIKAETGSCALKDYTVMTIKRKLPGRYRAVSVLIHFVRFSLNCLKNCYGCTCTNPSEEDTLTSLS